jgi:uncharacterized membrane-anchored protein
MFNLCRKSNNIRLRDEVLSSTLNSNNNSSINNNNNSYGTNTINYEIENSFLRKEIESLQKEIVNKQEYIKNLDFIYKKELEYINKELTNDYNVLVNNLYEENKALSNTIIKLNNENYNLEIGKKKYYEQQRYVDTLMCNICLDNFKNILLEPCNHLCCCDECYNINPITKCPLCRKDILATRKVFL